MQAVVREKVAILGTGGTIAGTAAHAGQGVGYRAAQLSVAELVRAVPDLALVAEAELCGEQVAQLDSKDMDHACWQMLAQRCQVWLDQPDVKGLVITHGTDTLEETAWFLHCVLAPSKPVVLTCAMRPATALMADGPQNLRDAMACAGGALRRPGVWVVAGGDIHGARQVRKAHPYRVQAFDSGEEGVAGWVEEGRPRWRDNLAPLGAESVLPVASLPPSSHWPHVEILHSHAGANGLVVDALVSLGVQGLVVAATGNGTVHQRLAAALGRARAAGVVVWRTTRCVDGQIVQGDELPDAEVSTLSPVKARISLMLELLRQGVRER